MKMSFTRLTTAIGGAVIALGIAGTVIMQTHNSATFAVKPGWYRWVDQSNSPARYAPAGMRGHDMSARCLCSEGFVAVKTGDNTFLIVNAPDGYQDTINKDFFSKPVPCWNCAD